MFFLTKSNIGIISLGIVGLGGVYAANFLLKNKKLNDHSVNIQYPINTKKSLLEHLSFSSDGKSKKCQVLLENTSNIINQCNSWMERIPWDGKVKDILIGSEEEVLRKLKNLDIDLQVFTKVEEKRIWRTSGITCMELEKLDGDTRIICSKNTPS